VVDKWYYTHGDEIHGPVSAAELRRLAHTGGLLPADLIWAAGVDASRAVPAEAALSLAAPTAEDREKAEPPATPVPDWVRDLRAVLAQGHDPAALPHAPFMSWLADVRRAEENAPPAKGPRAGE
jgi:hypothetical protein